MWGRRKCRRNHETDIVFDSHESSFVACSIYPDPSSRIYFSTAGLCNSPLWHPSTLCFHYTASECTGCVYAESNSKPVLPPTYLLSLPLADCIQYLHICTPSPPLYQETPLIKLSRSPDPHSIIQSHLSPSFCLTQSPTLRHPHRRTLPPWTNRRPP